MVLKKILHITFILFIFFILNINNSFCESRSIIDLKLGAGFGDLGICFEREYENQTSFYLGFGSVIRENIIEGYSLVSGLKYYFGKKSNRFFLNFLIGFIHLPYFNIGDKFYISTLGFEWRINKYLRATIEFGFSFFYNSIKDANGIAIGFVY